MKIAILSTHDISGGAAISAYRLYQGLKEVQEDVEMVVMHKHAEQNNNIVSVPDTGGKLLQKITKKLRYWKIKQTKGLVEKNTEIEKFSFEYAPIYWQNLKNKLNFDLLNIHWVNGFIDFKGIYELAEGKNVIFTLHDMAHFTGGCHYSKGCRAFENQCGCCPVLNSNTEKDVSRYNWNQKNKYIRQINPTVVTPSKWLADEASKSSLLGDCDIHVIPYGIDTHNFRPMEEGSPQLSETIPNDKFLILTGALDLNLPRKGVSLLIEALENMSENIKEEVCLLSFGKGNLQIKGVEAVSLGYLNGEELIQAYNVADLFVIPSRQDNLPNTVLEAMACGTPVIGFDVGGMPDMITHGLNGYLVKPFDTMSMAEHISTFVNKNRDKNTNVQFSKNAKTTVLENYALTKQANNYRKLFENIVK